MPSTIDAFNLAIPKNDELRRKKEDSQANASSNRPDYYLLACKTIMTLSACAAGWQSPPAALAGTILGFTVGYVKDVIGASEDNQSANYRVRMGYSAVMSAAIASGLAILQNENYTFGGTAALACVTTQKVFYPYVKEQLQ